MKNSNDQRIYQSLGTQYNRNTENIFGIYHISIELPSDDYERIEKNSEEIGAVEILKENSKQGGSHDKSERSKGS